MIGVKSYKVAVSEGAAGSSSSKDIFGTSSSEDAE